MWDNGEKIGKGKSFGEEGERRTYSPDLFFHGSQIP